MKLETVIQHALARVYTESCFRLSAMSATPYNHCDHTQFKMAAKRREAVLYHFTNLCLKNLQRKVHLARRRCIRIRATLSIVLLLLMMMQPAVMRAERLLWSVSRYETVSYNEFSLFRSDHWWSYIVLCTTSRLD